MKEQFLGEEKFEPDGVDVQRAVGPGTGGSQGDSLGCWEEQGIKIDFVFSREWIRPQLSQSAVDGVF